ncbi:energy transducer TonB [Thermodesulforhabdus norvegica]|uniref:TonB family C-terminal domain-containing protein n=1 Tax=Thermodesulforhabdus norvegica TaxID=39841 RepID=A0A1I4TE99_9BACT|nr:TonB family protein [Thermodesulforhabdus norvegica]SFM75098.1 TonB family C-terminal domain-containing protein [Thermodesulforhabdus norvegica]
MRRSVFGSNGETREYAKGVGISALIHMSLVVILLWMPFVNRTESRQYISNVYRVHLISAKEVDRGKAVSKVKTSRTASTTRSPAPRQPVQPLYPVQKIDIPDTKTEGVPGLALKPLEPAPELEPQAKKPSQKIASWEKLIPVIPVKKSGEETAENRKTERTVEEGDAEYGLARRLYYSEVWRAIQKQWALPVEFLGRGDLEAVIVIKVRRDGKILSMRFEKKSGNSLFDDSAWKAVKKADPLPPFPRIYSPPAEEIGIRFRPELAGG